MWTREEIKSNAKRVLKRSYWTAFLVSFILGLVSGGGGNFTYSFGGNIFGSSLGHNQDIGYSLVNGEFGDIDPTVIITILSVFAVIFVIAFLIGMAIKIFLAYPLEMGARKFFIGLTVQEVSVNTLGYGFKSGRYMNVVKTMFVRDLLIFLWGLLLVIPGIVKSYAYSMVPYILADNPQISYQRALEISNQMTMGEKGRMWVLDLSFIGWYLLGGLACGIGVLFVNPYVHATKAELYIVLRKKALQNGIFNYEELSISE